MSNTSTRKFGITSNLSGLTGGLIANSIAYNTSVETAEARNEKGQIIDLAAYSKSEEITVNGLYVGSGIEPGSVVTVGEKDYLVTASTKNESNSAFQEGSITAKSADNAVLHCLSSIISGVTQL